MDQLASMLQVVILLASLAVWGMILERLFTGEPLVPRTVPVSRPRPWLAVFLAALLLFVSLVTQFHRSRMTIEAFVFDADKALRIALETVLVKLITACALIACLTRLGSQRLTRFGIDGRHPRREIGLGVLGYLAAIIPVIIVTMSMSDFRADDNKHLFLQIIRSDQSVLLVALMIGSAVIMAPLEEELMYRVILQGTLQRYLSPTASIVISASLFSAVHGFPDAVGLFPLALILGFLYWRTGSYWAVVTTHAAFNGVTVLLTLMSPER